MLVLVMGLGGNVQVWAPVRRKLARSHTLVMYDMLGTGRSSPRVGPCSTEALIDELEALRAHLELERFRMIGYSFGATLSLSYAARRPAQVAAVATVSGTYRISPYTQRVFEVQAALARSLPRHEYVRQVGLWLLSERFVNETPEFFDRAVLMAQQGGGAVFTGWADFASAFKASYEAELRGLRCPLQVIHGAADRISPLRDVIGSLEHVSHRLDVVPEAGHLLPWDSPDVTADLLLEFFSDN